MANRWDFLTPSQRFWRFVKKADGCWLWEGTKNGNGYGIFHVHKPKRKCMTAHRFAFLDFRGPIAKGLQVDHICRNRACVNPAHLRLLTRKENILIGIGPSAINARKTHCVNGHKFSKRNTYIRKEGHRQCRKCVNERSRAFARQHP